MAGWHAVEIAVVVIVGDVVIVIFDSEPLTVAIGPSQPCLRFVLCNNAHTKNVFNNNNNNNNNNNK